MRKNGKMKKILAAALAAVLALPTPVLAADSYVKSMKVSDPEITMEVEDEDYVVVNLETVGGVSKEITAESSNPSALTVEVEPDEDNPNEILVIIDSFNVLGDATVTITTVGKGQNGKKLSQTVEVTVIEEVPDYPEDDLPDVPVKDTRKDGEYEVDGIKTTITTDETTGAQTKVDVLTKDGITETTTTVIEENGDYRVEKIITDSAGNTIREIWSSMTTDADGTIVETSGIKESDGSGFRKRITTDKAGNVKLQKEILGEVKNESLDSSSALLAIHIEEQLVGGGKVSSDYTPDKAGKGFMLRKMETENPEVEIPGMIKTVDGNIIPVPGIAEKAFLENTIKSLIIRLSIPGYTIGARALKDCEELKSIQFKGASQDMTISSNQKSLGAGAKPYNIILGKNSLQGTNKKLVITVDSKKDKKAVKKQLKKAGAKKAKVKVQK